MSPAPSSSCAVIARCTMRRLPSSTESKPRSSSRLLSATGAVSGRFHVPDHRLRAGRGGGRRYAPCAFTEQGVAMLSSVLDSERAIAVNIQIIRDFVRMRELLVCNRQLAQQLDQPEARLEKKHAAQAVQHRLHRRSPGELTAPSTSLYSPAYARLCDKSRR